MLPDLLQENLSIVICGTAVATQSADADSYYAGTGNKFWQVLFDVGLTDEKLTTEQYHRLLDFNIGLTDLVKGKSGCDAVLEQGDFDVVSFKEKMEKIHPRVICFNGKLAAATYLGRKQTNSIQYGFQGTLGNTQLFVAPSTSGAANRYWDPAIWQQLADYVKST